MLRIEHFPANHNKVSFYSPDTLSIDNLPVRTWTIGELFATIVLFDRITYHAMPLFHDLNRMLVAWNNNLINILVIMVYFIIFIVFIILQQFSILSS